MARTDAHRPLYVLEVDEPQRFKEHHDHRDGVCDLAPGNWGPGHCYLIYRARRNLCGCSMCTGRDDRRRERRWERHTFKQLLSDALKLDNWEDLDVWPRHWMAF